MTETESAVIPDNSEKTAVDEFMLAEYQTIAAAHFDLHNGLRQNFRFYLGLIAAPVTVFAVYKDPHIEVFQLPEVMLLLLAVISVLGFLMFLNMINTRFDNVVTVICLVPGGVPGLLFVCVLPPPQLSTAPATHNVAVPSRSRALRRWRVLMPNVIHSIARIPLLSESDGLIEASQRPYRERECRAGSGLDGRARGGSGEGEVRRSYELS